MIGFPLNPLTASMYNNSMNRFRGKKLALFSGAALALIVPYLIFLLRSPVVIVADQASVMLCGKERIRSLSRKAALSLYRPVKTVVIADDAGEDAIPFAVAEASMRPYCVLFPLRFVRPARRYRELNSGAPIVILEGRFNEDISPAMAVLGGASSDYHIYKTDIDADFYNAGLAAYALAADGNAENKGRIAVFLGADTQRQGREAFLRAINSFENPPQTVFLTSFSQYSEIPDLSCAVIAGAGSEFFENNPGVPVIFFTWIDPYLVPDETVLILDDTPWAQAVQAAEMAANGVSLGQIQSGFIFKNTKKLSRRALRKDR